VIDILSISRYGITQPGYQHKVQFSDTLFMTVHPCDSRVPQLEYRVVPTPQDVSVKLFVSVYPIHAYKSTAL